MNGKGKGLGPVIDWSKQPVDFWGNSTYFVCAHYNHCGEVGLISIRRHDWKPCSDWRDKQAIKNQIVGAKWEAAELYPAESRIQDRGNWYHLWVMPKGERYSFGFIESEVSRSDKPAKANEVQRPLAQRGDSSPLVKLETHRTSPSFEDDEAGILFLGEEIKREFLSAIASQNNERREITCRNRKQNHGP